jgi:alpha/beta superfamily hydrolase
VNLDPKPLRHIDLHSSAGRLEALYRELQDPAGVAVICHPHPLGGGTLHNKIVFRAARGFENANVATLRFNFRGAGASAGKHDEGEGEQDDLMAAISGRKNAPRQEADRRGFSFGAWVAGRVQCRKSRRSF